MARDHTVPTQRPEIRLQSDPFTAEQPYGFESLLDWRSPDTPCWASRPYLALYCQLPDT
jgi:hypothetical protein